MTLDADRQKSPLAPVRLSDGAQKNETLFSARRHCGVHGNRFAG
jgi:hypothetical protein